MRPHRIVFLNQAFCRAVEHANRTRQPLSVLLLDLNQVGGNLLTQFLHQVRACLDTRALSMAHGGEICLVLPGSSRAFALGLLARLQRLLDAIPRPLQTKDIRLTVGVGEHQPRMTALQLLTRADSDLESHQSLFTERTPQPPSYRPLAL